MHTFFENKRNLRFRKWNYFTSTKTIQRIARSVPTFPKVISIPGWAGVTENSQDQFHSILPHCPHNAHNCQSSVSVQLSPHFRILGLALYCFVVTLAFPLLHPQTWHDSVHQRKMLPLTFYKNINPMKPPHVLDDYRALTEQSLKNAVMSWFMQKNPAHHKEITSSWHPVAHIYNEMISNDRS